MAHLTYSTLFFSLLTLFNLYGGVKDIILHKERHYDVTCAIVTVLFGVIWTASSKFGTYRLCEQRRFRRACASAQSHQNLCCLLIQAVSQEEPSDRKPDPWPLWIWACAVKICHDGMLEDTNSLDGPHMMKLMAELLFNALKATVTSALGTMKVYVLPLGQGLDRRVDTRLGPYQSRRQGPDPQAIHKPS